MNLSRLKRVAAIRLVLATLLLIGLYVGLEGAAFWLFLHMDKQQEVTAWLFEASHSEIDKVDSASLPREVVLPRSYRLAAFDLGIRMGVAAEMAGKFAGSDFSAEQRRAALREAQDFAQQGGWARALLGAEAKVLQSANVKELSKLSERIEADENGLAARVEAKTSLRGRHLFLLGMQIGRTVWSPKRLGTSMPAAIATHASLAGLPKGLWIPLLQPPTGSSSIERRARYDEAIEKVRQTLMLNPPPR